jgi:geranylgeranyl pyrophosphate synthase
LTEGIIVSTNRDAANVHDPLIDGCGSPEIIKAPPEGNLVGTVRHLLKEWFCKEECFKASYFVNQNPSVGKMLRTLLVQRLCQAAMNDFNMDAMAYSCAAVELVHAATLFHDDVIDGGEVRRGEPALWRQTTTSGSILIGDLFLCRAIGFLTKKGNVKLIDLFINKMHETCSAEIRQELVLRGKTLEEKDCLVVARGKTGPLFAFCAALCSKGDLRLESALEEAGYRIGTAYQLADDLIDEKGDANKSQKTLGTDRLRKKYTLAAEKAGHEGRLKGLIDSLCDSALELLASWPPLREGLQEYLEKDFYPAILLQCDL